MVFFLFLRGEGEMRSVKEGRREGRKDWEGGRKEVRKGGRREGRK